MVFRSAIVLIIGVILCTGCAQKEGVKRDIEKQKIVVSFYPLYNVTQYIAGERADVVNIAQGQEVHEYVPSPGDVQKMYDADLVIVMGGGLEPWATDVLPRLHEHGVPVVNISENLPFYSPASNKHENVDEHVADHNVDHDEHDHGDFDPHIWLDPVMMQDIVRVIGGAIIQIDESAVGVYNENILRLNAEFADIDASYRAGLAKCAHREAIISHEAFGYIERRYDLHLHAIAGLSTMDEPSAQVMAQLQKEASDGVTHVLAEQNSVQRFAQTIAQDTGLQMIEINALERGTGDPKISYGDVMRKNLQALREALGCE